jgi:hypothetical protein
LTVTAWPKGFFRPLRIEWDFVGGQITAGFGKGGVQQVGSMSGGPLVCARLSDITVRGRDAINAARAFKARLSQGLGLVRISVCEHHLAPLVAGYTGDGVPHDDGSPFSDSSLYYTEAITATSNGGAALNAVQMTLSMAGAYRAIQGGEPFSVYDADMGEHIHFIDGLLDGGTDAFPIVTFWPPLRFAVTDGQAINFDNPGCVMRLNGDFPLPVDMGRWATFSLEFVEVLDDTLGAAPPRPTQITAEDVGSGDVEVDWVNPWSTKFDHSRVYRADSPDPFASAVDASGPVTGSRGTASGFTDMGLAAGTYRYWVVSETSDNDQSPEGDYVEVVVA